MATRSQSFRKPEARNWSRLIPLILGVQALLYALYTMGAIWTGGLFGFAGIDYRSFRASAEIVATRGFSELYDLNIQEQFQRPLYESSVKSGSGTRYETAPLYYLPVFVLPMLLLLPFSPVAGFVFWTVLNALLLLLYLRRLGSTLSSTGGLPPWTLLLFSLPAFWTLFFGQVGVWLLVCLGEFLLAILRGKEWTAGFWLAGFLLKPQALILLLPGLLLARRFKVLAGVVLAGLALVVLSALLAGPPALLALGRLFIDSTAGLATNNPFLMMNWRALAVNLETVLPSPLAWGLSIAGLSVTAAAALSLWVRPTRVREDFSLILLGTYAATCAVSWHAHMHMALPAAAPLLALVAAGRASRAMLAAWVAIPALVFFIALVLVGRLAMNLAGLGMLAMNVVIAGWSARELWRPHLTQEVSPLGPAATK